MGDGNASRNILTVYDSNGDGLIDASDSVIAFHRDNADVLVDYLVPKGSDFCAQLAGRLGRYCDLGRRPLTLTVMAITINLMTLSVLQKLLRIAAGPIFLIKIIMAILRTMLPGFWVIFSTPRRSW